jgi:curved DNA-binding protein CbpA
MPTATHYTVLGLVPTAAPEVIRAAYKALALICHPDKTAHMVAIERASHAVVFNDVQAAYDVIGNPALKAAYDAELQRNANISKLQHSTSRRRSPYPAPSEASSTTKRRPSVKMTTPAERTAMRAQAREQLDHLRQKRTERDITDAQMDVACLKDMVHTWKQLAEDNTPDPVMHAHCAIRIHEYEQKLFEREQQHKEWLANLSTAKQEPSMVTAKHDPATANASPKPAAYAPSVASHRSNTDTARVRTDSASPTASVRGSVRADARKRAEAERTAATAAATAREEARQAEKAQREAVKQAHLDSKATAVRVGKEKQKAKAAQLAQKDAERIVKARAKAGAAPLGIVRAVVDPEPNDESQASPSVADSTAPRKSQAPMQKICSKCGVEHASFREWMKCNAPAKQADEDKALL